MPITGGIGLATRRDGSPGSSSIADTYFDGLIRSSAQRVWDDYRPGLEHYLRDQLAAPGRIAAEATLYALSLDLAHDVDLAVDRDANGDLIVHVVTSTCSIEATAASPGSHGSWADPSFSVSYALDLVYRIELPPTLGPLRTRGFERVHVLAPTLDSQHFTADATIGVNPVIDYFAGTRFAQLVEKFVAQIALATYVEAGLAPLNAELARLAGQGFGFLEAVVDRLDGGSGGGHGLLLPGAPAGRLDLLLTAVSLESSGAIEGEVSWPRSMGMPVPHGEATDGLALPNRSAPLQLAALAAALATEQTRSWQAVTQPTSDFALTAPWPLAQGTIIALPDSGAAAATSASVVGATAAPLSARAEATVAGALAAVPDSERLEVSQQVRDAVVHRFIAMVGGSTAFAELQTEFLRGHSDFQVLVSVTLAGGAGSFPDEHQVGALASMRVEDDAATYRRRFRVVGLPLGASLTVRCDVAADHAWSGPVVRVGCAPAGWTGQVTVLRAPPPRPLSQSLDGHVEVRLPERAPTPDRRRSFDEARATPATGRGTDGPLVHLHPPEDGPRGGSLATVIVADPVAERASATRQNPTGRGTVRGIDFQIEVSTPAGFH